MFLFPIGEILLVLIGVTLILLGALLYFRSGVHVYKKRGTYTYISVKEMKKRVLLGTISAVILTFGVAFLGVISFRPVALQSLLSALFLGLCSSPIVFFGSIYQFRKNLEPYTKREGDIVSVEKTKTIN